MHVLQMVGVFRNSVKGKFVTQLTHSVVVISTSSVVKKGIQREMRSELYTLY